MRRRASSGEGTTVRSRLLLLVLFPLAVLALSLGFVAQGRWTEREAGADVVDRVDDLRSLVALQSALYDERASVELEVRSASFGVSSLLGGGLLGVQDSRLAQPATDAAIQAAGPLPPSLVGLLDEARAAHLQRDVDAIRLYERVDDVLVERLVFEVEAMQSVGVGTADEHLAEALQQLEAGVVTFSASMDQTTGLADAWFGAGPEQRASALSALGLDTARYELAVEGLDAANLSDDVRSWTIAGDDLVSETAQLFLTDGPSRPDAGDFSNLPLIISVFEASFGRNAAFADLVVASADDVELVAARIAQEASDAFIFALVVGGVAIALSIVLSWRLAVSIATPMASVAQRTRELQRGRIVSEPLEMVGPRELRDVASAINDVSVNLGALEGKLAALAKADLDDPRLVEPLPGRLGKTLMSSVRTLSQSIADRRDLQHRLRHQANHDALTGLANRAAVLDHLSDLLANADERPVGLLFVDLDDFKRANDIFGHGVGDQVLIEVAARLRAACRPSDLVARLGGDEFLVVANDVAANEVLVPIAKRIMSEVSRPMDVSGTGGLTLSVSVGIAVTHDAAASSLEFLAFADAALYLAKTADDRLGIFDDELREKIGRRSTIEQRLRSALTHGQLEVAYQPVLRSDTSEVAQIEALVRWANDEGWGPDVFIPVAEASDLVIEIDRFVFHTATAELAALIAEGAAPDMRVAVNLSGRHLLHADVVEHVTDAIAVSGLEPSRLIIEVTETALVADLDRAAEHLTALRSLGVRVSVDDFGTGFTSISQLRCLPIDELKIDRSLVMELPGDETLVRVVHDLAAHFDLTTVAEGVETIEQATFLRDLGCSQLQGWLFARAMTPHDLRAWLAAKTRLGPTDRVAATDLP